MDTKHSAAIIIQSRFWFAQARWKTRARLWDMIVHRGLDYQHLQQDPIPIELFVKDLVFSPLANSFAAWLRRIIRMCSRETNVLCSDMQLLMTEEPGSAVNRALSAYLFALYKGEALDRHLPFAEELYQAALKLCASINSNHHPTRITTPRDAGTTIMHSLQAFLAVHREWRERNEEIVLRRLLHGAISRMHTLISTRAPQPYGSGTGTLAMRYMATLGYEGLPVMRFIATTGDINPVRQTIFDTSAVRIMSRVVDNEFWGAQGLHTSRFVHELMIDNGFKLSMQQTVPLLSKKYSSHSRTWRPSEVIQDAGTIILWECRRAEEIIELTEAMDVDRYPNLLSDIPTTVNRICSVVRSIVPNIEQDEGNTNSSDQGNQLQRLLRCALTLRNIIANVRLNDLRVQQPTTLAHYMRHVNTNRGISISTRRWIQAAVVKQSKTTLLEPLAQGDPFALLKLHDNAIIDIVLQKQSWFVPPNQLEINLLPDILYFDYERLRNVYQSLRTCPEDGFYKNSRFDSMFRELVTSGDRIRAPLSPQVSDAAATLRSVVFVCRFKHGNAIAMVAHEIAGAILAGEGNGSRLVTTHRPAAG
jgi:hypothetical protein